MFEVNVKNVMEKKKNEKKEWNTARVQGSDIWNVQIFGIFRMPNNWNIWYL